MTKRFRTRLPSLAGGMGLLLVLSMALNVTAAEAADCFVCGGPAADSATRVTYRGVARPLCSPPCMAHWNAAEADGKLDALVQRHEPRAALFQGDSRFLNPEFQAAHPIQPVWLWAGVWILAAIVSGALSAALAVPAHRSGLGAFGLGFALPLLGIALTGLLPRRSGELPLRGSKIPQTHAEDRCRSCGRPLHPAALCCSGCGAAHTPAMES
ncbi:MAG: hypothetical protein HN919_11255, partial [Verrucomicrobia bacterium]|nr:hypothetical protein [Verrucomicrobiota bacterium]